MRRFRDTATPRGLRRDERDRLTRLRATDGPLLLRLAHAVPPALIVAAGLAIIIAGWALLTLYVERLGFAVLAPRAQAAVEAAAALARLFGALALALFFARGPGEGRLLWVAGGLLVQGFGSLAFGTLEIIFGGTSDLNTAAYQSLVVWTVAGALFFVGLVPRRTPRFGWGALGATLAVFGTLGVAAYEEGYTLPPLVLVFSPEAAVALGSDLPGITPWHLALSAVPFCLTVAATVGAASGHRRGDLPGWLPVAMVLFAGTQSCTACSGPRPTARCWPPRTSCGSPRPPWSPLGAWWSSGA